MSRIISPQVSFNSDYPKLPCNISKRTYSPFQLHAFSRQACPLQKHQTSMLTNYRQLNLARSRLRRPQPEPPTPKPRKSAVNFSLERTRKSSSTRGPLTTSSSAGAHRHSRRHLRRLNSLLFNWQLRFASGFRAAPLKTLRRRLLIIPAPFARHSAAVKPAARRSPAAWALRAAHLFARQPPH